MHTCSVVLQLLTPACCSFCLSGSSSPWNDTWQQQQQQQQQQLSATKGHHVYSSHTGGRSAAMAEALHAS
jgi:hypothetical protein